MQRKRRTRDHVIEEMGVNFLERQVLRRGHQLQRPGLREYGCDATMFHFAQNGEIEDGEVRFQVKATDALQLVEKNQVVCCRVEAAHLSYWYWQIPPFVLVLYDAKKHRAYWLHLQPHIDRHPDILAARQKTVTLRIPVANALNVRAVDRIQRFPGQMFSREGARDERPSDLCVDS